VTNDQHKVSTAAPPPLPPTHYSPSDTLLIHTLCTHSPAPTQAAQVPADALSIDEMIKLMDANKDGVIGWSEFEGFMMEVGGGCCVQRRSGAGGGSAQPSGHHPASSAGGALALNRS